METSATIPIPSANTPAAARVLRTETTPWYCRAVVVAATLILVGIVWDISWHSTIGRDTLWTPAHIVIQLGGIVPALLSEAIASASL